MCTGKGQTTERSSGPETTFRRREQGARGRSKLQPGAPSLRQESGEREQKVNYTARTADWHSTFSWSFDGTLFLKFMYLVKPKTSLGGEESKSGRVRGMSKLHGSRGKRFTEQCARSGEDSSASAQRPAGAAQTGGISSFTSYV